MTNPFHFNCCEKCEGENVYTSLPTATKVHMFTVINEMLNAPSVTAESVPSSLSLKNRFSIENQ